ncbi:MAG: hypothetical protein ACYS30_16070 [Planctomycetota bacterium]|jgi:Ni/Fe-hydrogenase subunit HybB-like protein
MGALIVIYCFLSGLGAGTFLTAAGLRIFGSEKYAKIEKNAAIDARLLLVPGLIDSVYIGFQSPIKNLAYQIKLLQKHNNKVV